MYQPPKPPPGAGPQSFVGGPSPERLAVRPVRVVEVAPAVEKRTHLKQPTMSVSITRRVVLSGELFNQLDRAIKASARPLAKGEPEDPRRRGLCKGFRLDLIPPPRQGIWLLDTRPTVGAPLTLSGSTRPQFRTAYHIGQAQMTVCRSTGQAGSLVCKVVSTVTLELIGPHPAFPDVFQFKAR